MRNKGNRTSIVLIFTVSFVLLISTVVSYGDSEYGVATDGLINFHALELSEGVDANETNMLMAALADENDKDDDDYDWIDEEWRTIDGKTYYYVDGEPVKGSHEVGDTYYGFDENGVLTSGWIRIGTNTWYTDSNGVIQTGYKTIDGDKYYFMKDDDYTEDDYCMYGLMADSGSNKKYIVSYTGKLYKIPDKSSDKSCKKIAGIIAKCCGKNAKDMSAYEKISRAAYTVACFSQRATYTNKGKYYNKPYGVFYKKEYTCAGSTRALGLVLTKMGFKWKHVNENKNKHQWCTLKVKGKWYWADGQIGYAGKGKNNPFA